MRRCGLFHSFVNLVQARYFTWCEKERLIGELIIACLKLTNHHLMICRRHNFSPHVLQHVHVAFTAIVFHA